MHDKINLLHMVNILQEPTAPFSFCIARIRDVADKYCPGSQSRPTELHHWAHRLNGLTALHHPFSRFHACYDGFFTLRIAQTKWGSWGLNE
jgi:hypothetical protein